MSNKIKINLFSILFIAVMLASLLLNLGWLRLVLTYTLFPVIHSVIFFLGNNFSAKYIAENEAVKYITISSYATFLLPHILMPDTADIGEAYMFFHIIESSAIAGVCTKLGLLIFAVHIALVFTQYILCICLRRKHSREVR